MRRPMPRHSRKPISVLLLVSLAIGSVVLIVCFIWADGQPDSFKNPPDEIKSRTGVSRTPRATTASGRQRTGTDLTSKILREQAELQRDCDLWSINESPPLKYDGLGKSSSSSSSSSIGLTDKMPVICPLVLSLRNSHLRAKGLSAPRADANPGIEGQQTDSSELVAIKKTSTGSLEAKANNERVKGRTDSTSGMIDDPTEASSKIEQQVPVDSSSSVEFNFISGNSNEATVDSSFAGPPLLSPVILIPGFGGSQLQDKLNKSETNHWWCTSSSDWQDGFWIGFENFLPFVSDCWLDNFRLEYDEASGFAEPPEGVNVRAYPFGSTSSVSSLDSSLASLTSYMAELIDKLVGLGYQENENLFAAPYDFRLAPQQLDDYFEKLKKLIELGQDKHGQGKQVTLICHSMGCLNSLIFLRQQEPQWRTERILKLVTMSAPWGGAMDALQEILTGGVTSVPFFSDTTLRDIIRTFPAIAMLLPNEAFAAPYLSLAQQEVPIVIRPEGNYTVKQMDSLLQDAKLDQQLDWYHKIQSLLRPLEVLPDVNILCLHGSNISTTRSLLFTEPGSFPDGDYQLLTADGDGTVNWESLAVCQHWAKLHPDRIQFIEIPNTNHLGILSEDSALTTVARQMIYLAKVNGHQ